MDSGVIKEEILVVICSDFLGHFLHCARDACIRGKLEKVTDVTGPAAQICGALDTGMIGHIHAAKHMGKLYPVTVGQGKRFQLAQSAGAGIVCLVLICNEVNKRSVLLAAEGIPCAGIILFHAGTDVVND